MNVTTLGNTLKTSRKALDVTTLENTSESSRKSLDERKTDLKASRKALDKIVNQIHKYIEDTEKRIGCEKDQYEDTSEAFRKTLNVTTLGNTSETSIKVLNGRKTDSKASRKALDKVINQTQKYIEDIQKSIG